MAGLCAGESGADGNDCKDAAGKGGKGVLRRQPDHPHQRQEVGPVPGQDADIPGSSPAQRQANLIMAPLPFSPASLVTSSGPCKKQRVIQTIPSTWLSSNCHAHFLKKHVHQGNLSLSTLLSEQRKH